MCLIPWYNQSFLFKFVVVHDLLHSSLSILIKSSFFQDWMRQLFANFVLSVNLIQTIFSLTIQRFWKGVVLYVSHNVWPTKKILGFWWSNKAEITLGTIRFWQNISISIIKFSPFLYTMKACQWNLINFSKFVYALIKKEKKHWCSCQWEKKNLEKLDFAL